MRGGRIPYIICHIPGMRPRGLFAPPFSRTRSLCTCIQLQSCSTYFPRTCIPLSRNPLSSFPSQPCRASFFIFYTYRRGGAEKDANPGENLTGLSIFFVLTGTTRAVRQFLQTHCKLESLIGKVTKKGSPGSPFNFRLYCFQALCDYFPSPGEDQPDNP